jgi:hypothetical protein
MQLWMWALLLYWPSVATGSDPSSASSLLYFKLNKSNPECEVEHCRVAGSVWLAPVRFDNAQAHHIESTLARKSIAKKLNA